VRVRAILSVTLLVLVVCGRSTVSAAPATSPAAAASVAPAPASSDSPSPAKALVRAPAGWLRGDVAALKRSMPDALRSVDFVELWFDPVSDGVFRPNINLIEGPATSAGKPDAALAAFIASLGSTVLSQSPTSCGSYPAMRTTSQLAMNGMTIRGEGYAMVVGATMYVATYAHLASQAPQQTALDALTTICDSVVLSTQG
jgi:hypothetical protein